MAIKQKQDEVTMSGVKPFPGQVQETVQYPGKRYQVEELVGEVFIVHECQIQESRRYGNRFATVKISDLEQEEFGWFRTSSSILVEQLEQFQEQLPWQATILKKGRAYSFANPYEIEKKSIGAKQ